MYLDVHDGTLYTAREIFNLFGDDIPQNIEAVDF